ncbi:hypothetical protein CL617_05025 [archaeon]|nr:hypothetical protein [archaeon]|tara:strand:- start:514 stop:1053 length:540 start_codon:yes stop_codon:yes gene_type:complete
MTRKFSGKNRIILALSLLLLVLLTINLLKIDEVKFIQDGDFTNKEEGTIVFNILLDTRLDTEYITFFKSNLIKGLSIKYNIKTSIIEAGLPLLTSKEKLFDNQKHQVAYTYKKDQNQILYLDGEEIAQSPYSPSIYSRLLTGFVVLEDENLKKPNNLEIINKQLSSQDIKNMFKTFKQR